MLKSRESLTDHVANALIERITAGHYPVGSKLPAGRLLAQEFDVSAAVIREATERLRTKGLVRTRQGAGCMVIADTLDDGFQLDPALGSAQALLHVYELRAGLEGAAAALAATRATPDDLAHMAYILKQLKATLYTPERAVEWDIAFHRSLAAATHNPHYSQLLAYLSEQWRQSVRIARRHTLAIDAEGPAGHDRTARVHEEHEAILAALRARDPQAARHLAEEHLRRACERLGLEPGTAASTLHPLEDEK